MPLASSQPHHDDETPDNASGDPRCLLWASGELSETERREFESALSTDASLRESAESLRDDLALLDLAVMPNVSEAEANRAAARARTAMHSWLSEPAVAGRIAGGAVVDQDASSRVWKYARWPLAAAAVIVAGLVGLTMLSEQTGMNPFGKVASETDAPRQESPQASGNQRGSGNNRVVGNPNRGGQNRQGGMLRGARASADSFPTAAELEERRQRVAAEREVDVDSSALQLAALFDSPDVQWTDADASAESDPSVDPLNVRRLASEPQALGRRLANLSMLAALVTNDDGSMWQWDDLGG